MYLKEESPHYAIKIDLNTFKQFDNNYDFMKRSKGPWKHFQMVDKAM